MNRSPIRSRPDLDADLPPLPRQEAPLEVRLALLRRRCPKCGCYLFREPPDRTFCLACAWEHYGGDGG